MIRSIQDGHFICHHANRWSVLDIPGNASIALKEMTISQNLGQAIPIETKHGSNALFGKSPYKRFRKEVNSPGLDIFERLAFIDDPASRFLRVYRKFRLINDPNIPLSDINSYNLDVWIDHLEQAAPYPYDKWNPFFRPQSYYLNSNHRATLYPLDIITAYFRLRAWGHLSYPRKNRYDAIFPSDKQLERIREIYSTDYDYFRQLSSHQRPWSFSSNEPIFFAVITYGRSGSTVIKEVLNSLPAARIRGENGGAIAGLGMSAWSAKKFAGRPTNSHDPWEGMNEVSANTLRNSLRSVVLKDILGWNENLKYTGFKEIRFDSRWIPHGRILDWCEGMSWLFPNIVFILNTRESNNCAKSGWWTQDPNASAYLDTQRQALMDLHQVLLARNERSFLMKYETWANNPEGFDQLFDKLGIEPNKKALKEIMERKLVH